MALLPKAPGLRIENVASDAYTVSLTIASTSPRPRWVWVCPVSTDCLPLNYNASYNGGKVKYAEDILQKESAFIPGRVKQVRCVTPISSNKL